jgi:cell division protein FtsB
VLAHMNFGVLIRILFCIFCLGIFLYSYIEKQNVITELRLAIPSVSKELQSIQEENTRLRFEIDQFENPQHLLELSRRPEYRHLKHPLLKDIIMIPTSPKTDD